MRDGTTACVQFARLKMVGKNFSKKPPWLPYSSEVAEQVSSMAIDLSGGNGNVKEYPVEKYYRLRKNR